MYSTMILFYIICFIQHTSFQHLDNNEYKTHWIEIPYNGYILRVDIFCDPIPKRKQIIFGVFNSAVAIYLTIPVCIDIYSVIVIFTDFSYIHKKIDNRRKYLLYCILYHIQVHSKLFSALFMSIWCLIDTIQQQCTEISQDTDILFKS